MSHGSGEVIAWVVIGVSLVFALIVWIERRPERIVPDEPVVGDATETPTTLHNARRANHARNK